MPRVTYKLHEPNGRKFTIAGTGLTRAAAVAEANAKLAMTVGTVDGMSVSDDLTGPETGEPFADDGSYSDANLVLRNAAGQTRTVHLENIENGLGDGVTGDIDLDAGLIIAFATAYRDGDGAGGYVPYGGKFAP